MIEEDIYSNLAVVPIQIDGEIWHSAEQYYQAAKFTDAAIIDKIKACENPYLCAALGQTRRYPLRADWEQVKAAVMERAIRARFEQHPAMAERLKRSTGRLYDHTAVDDYWGIGADGRGGNVTGRILMRIREELNAEQPAGSISANAAASSTEPVA
ncbi:MAG: NADAR family protein [Verrucomicrobiota bacterium JB024]|nr:NADAR family protein [Verrucomicrobiota bacterium JB024]